MRKDRKYVIIVPTKKQAYSRALRGDADIFYWCARKVGSIVQYDLSDDGALLFCHDARNGVWKKNLRASRLLGRDAEGCVILMHYGEGLPIGLTQAETDALLAELNGGDAECVKIAT